MSINEKIEDLRAQLTKAGLDAYIIPSTDPHMGEYVPERWAERAWISGFTGSAGTVVVTHDFAGLWTDSRYFIQAEEQLKDSDMELVKLQIPHTPEHIEWLSHNLKVKARVGINGLMVSTAIVRHITSLFVKKEIELITDVDLVQDIWIDRPELPDNMVIDHNVKFAGIKRQEKILDIKEAMKTDNASHHLVCSLDEIAWALNLRGSDVSFNPLFVSYLLIGQSQVTLYVNRKKLPASLFRKLEQAKITIKGYLAIFKDLENLTAADTLMIDPSKTNQALINCVGNDVRIKEDLGYITRMKSIKNEKEIEGLHNVMIKDGVAWVKFLHWLETNIGDIDITELTAAQKLDHFRQEQENYMGPSFHPISSFGYHGAIVHYAVDEKSAIDLKTEGIYLCDTGGQYLDGTTDTTRTIALGTPTTLQKMDFTLALKGTMAVSMLRFPAGTKGYQMDILARKALWDYGLNYGHGTGHGVGFFLNVHEGPQTIGSGASGNMHTSLQPGMVTTVEPAIYRDGAYGMRTENMTLCINDITNEFGEFFCFKTLTLAPIDISLVEVSLMSPEELRWLNTYHLEVRDKLTPFLTTEQKYWLFEKTREIEHGSDN